MKHLLVLSLCFLFISGYSQEPTEKKDANFYKNEGNTSYKAKDFAKAFENYTQALELLSEENIIDTSLLYNAGYSAYKAKNYGEAVDYFSKCIEYKYKEINSFQNKTVCQLKTKDIDGMEETVLQGLEIYPDDKKLNKYASMCYLKKGLVFYNDGNKIKKAANESGLNKTDTVQFKAEYEKANNKYEEALPIMEKAYNYNQQNKNVLKVLVNIYTNLDMQDKLAKAKSELDALEK
ncbi:MAG: tetratricopeptide repeat protein [Bacteroidales bacterium]|nr:tetratricopeptide repeat protein [Bacteroidales bacterium]